VVLTMGAILRRCAAIVAKRSGIRFGRHRSIRPSVAANLSGIPLYGAADDQTSHILRLARGLGRLRGGGIWLGGSFYGPPVFLEAIRESGGWSVSLVSGAVTSHFLLGAFIVANLAALHRHVGWWQ
jgi:hypothetical protein